VLLVYSDQGEGGRPEAATLRIMSMLRKHGKVAQGGTVAQGVRLLCE